MATGLALRQEIGCILQEIDPVMYWEWTNTGTSAAQITSAAQLGSTRYTSQSWQDYFVLVSGSTSNTNSQKGSLSYARTLTPSTGVLTVSPNFNGALENADTGELWRDNNPDDINRMIDRVLSQRCWRKRLVPLSWAVDGDFLASGVTNWTGSSATPTKVAKTGLETFSEYTLRVLNSGANGYAGQTVNNPKGANTGGEASDWFLWGLAQADVGTAVLTAYDLTNSAALTLTGLHDSRTSWAGEAFQVLAVTCEAGATTETISLRFGGSGASDDSYWGLVCCYPQDARLFVLPSRIPDATYIGKVYEAIGTDWPTIEFKPLANQPRKRDVGGSAVALEFDEDVGQRALFYEEQ